MLSLNSHSSNFVSMPRLEVKPPCYRVSISKAWTQILSFFKILLGAVLSIHVNERQPEILFFFFLRKFVHCTLVIFNFEHDFEWAFSFYSAAHYLHNPLWLFALPSSLMDIKKCFNSCLPFVSSFRSSHTPIKDKPCLKRGLSAAV